MRLNIIYYNPLPNWHNFSNEERRFRSSTPEYPYLHADLLNYVFFSNKSSIGRVEKNEEFKSLDESAIEGKVDVLAYGVLPWVLNVTAWTPSNVIGELNSHFISGKRLGFNFNLWAVFTIVDLNVLFLQLALVVFSAIITFKAESFYGKGISTNKHLSGNGLQPKLRQCVGIFLMISMFKAIQVLPKSTASRILIGFWWTAVIVYISLLGTHMMDEVMALGVPKRIDHLKDILEHPYIQPRIASYSKGYFQSGSEDEKEFWKIVEKLAPNMQFAKLFDDLEFGVAEGKSVICVEFNIGAAKVWQRKKFGFHISRHTYMQNYLTAAFRKSLHVETKERFNSKILRVSESGLPILAQTLIEENVKPFLIHDSIETKPLQFLHQAPSLFFLSFGWLISLFALALEYLSSSAFKNEKLKKRQKQRQNSKLSELRNTRGKRVISASNLNCSFC